MPWILAFDNISFWQADVYLEVTGRACSIPVIDQWPHVSALA
jgi:hypothetical protein